MKTIVTDGQLGQLAVKQNELFGRAKKGVYASFDEMLDALQLVIEGKAPIVPTLAVSIAEIFRLAVDYSQSLEQMIATGRYDWTNSDITAKRFPITGKGIMEFEARYFRFNRNISSEKAIEAMAEEGWEPAKIEHLLCFGEKYPDEQRKFPIVALGSVAEVDGSRRVPCLGRVDSGRDLCLGWFGRGWVPDGRFLAVRKVSGS